MRQRGARTNTKKKYSKKRGPVRSKKVSIDGIDFASGLEKYMYLALKKAKIPAIYEGETFELQSSFELPFESYECQANGKGEYCNRGSKKVLNIKVLLKDSFLAIRLCRLSSIILLGPTSLFVSMSSFLMHGIFSHTAVPTFSSDLKFSCISISEQRRLTNFKPKPEPIEEL